MTIRRMRIASWITKAAHTRARIYTRRICLVAFSTASGYSNAPHCYVTRVLPVLFILTYFQLLVLVLASPVVAR